LPRGQTLVGAPARERRQAAREGGKIPLFRSAIAKTGALTDKPMNRIDAYRALDATDIERLFGPLGLTTPLPPPSCRG
jgi:hypothetical protein